MGKEAPAYVVHMSAEVVKAAMDGFQAKLSSSSTRVSEEHKTTTDKIRAHQDAANQWLKSEKAIVDMQRTTAQQHVQDIEQFRTSMAQTHTDITVRSHNIPRAKLHVDWLRCFCRMLWPAV